MSFLFGKKQTISTTENKLGAIRIQSSSQGLPIPIVFGKTRISSNLLDYFDFTAIAHTETPESGGKDHFVHVSAVQSAGIDGGCE